GRTVATIDFTTPAAKLAPADHTTIDRIAAAFRAKPGIVHVVAYAAAAAPGHAELDNYRAALDRGQAVAKALAEDGVPVGKISTEAEPALPGAPSGRVLIRLAS
ncbi:MAG: OmpA family protein, partial [Stellaceae bacterium]